MKKHPDKQSRQYRAGGRYRQSYVTRNFNRRHRNSGVPGKVDFGMAERPEANCHLVLTAVRDFVFNVPVLQDEVNNERPPTNPMNQLGALIQSNVPVVTTNDYESFCAAFNKRCNFEATEGDDIHDLEFNMAMDLIGEVPQQELWDMNEHDWNRWLKKFTPAKQARMIKGRKDIFLYSDEDLGTKDLSVKVEALLKRNDPNWAPRIIYVGSDAFNAITGPAMMIFMDRLVKHFEPKADGSHLLGDVEVKLAYKTNDTDIVSFLDSRDHPKSVEGDFSANDREQRARVTTIFDLWMKKMGMPPWLTELFIAHRKFKVVSRKHGLRARIKNQLPTGTTITTARNSAYDATIFAVSVRKQGLRRRISKLGVLVPAAKAAILGDDVLASIFKEYCVALWKVTADNFRMILKGSTPRLHGEATFLSRRVFLQGSHGGFLVPLLGKALAKFNVRTIQNEALSDSQYMAGKALSHAYEFRHVPLLRDIFMQRFKGEDYTNLEMADLSYFTKISGIDVNNLEKYVHSEKVLCSEDNLREWLIETYDIGLCDTLELFEAVVLNKNPLELRNVGYQQFSIDW